MEKQATKQFLAAARSEKNTDQIPACSFEIISQPADDIFLSQKTSQQSDRPACA
jgi:hypothetical protein